VVILLWVVLGFLSSCAPKDADGDGEPAIDAGGLDCDDTNPAVNPSADELCGDGLDNDCDGAVDDAGVDAEVFHPDADGDGFGDPTTSLESCSVPNGHVTDGTDCDDDAPEIAPDAVERCNSVDDDCDGLVDDADPNLAEGNPYFVDADDDGYGAGPVVLACAAAAGLAQTDDDCDDAAPEVHPGQAEICNGGVDDDCDGLADSEDPSLEAEGARSVWPDADGDGYGNAATAAALACEVEAGRAEVGGDCLDTDASVNPGAVESCVGPGDEDCDGLVDDADPTLDLATAAIWHADGDGDGYGDAEAPIPACELPAGAVGNADDCDDTDGDVRPDALERCATPADDDCDGLLGDDDPSVSDGVPAWVDGDGDGYGAGPEGVACALGAGLVGNGADCDDGSAAVRPDASEVCNGYDDDCDGASDDVDVSLDVGSTLIWYADIDHDGFGNPAEIAQACAAPVNHVGDATDCDDRRPEVNPSEVEVCGGLDDDCDGLVDLDDPSIDATELATFYADADGDGWGVAGVTFEACELPAGYAVDPGDCDDALGSVSPDADETCATAYDDDCDGLANEADGGLVDAIVWYFDADADGFGTASATVEACAPPDRFVGEGTDCDDLDDDVFPGGTERCGAPDEDCDGLVDDEDPSVDPTSFADWFADVDGDGFGDLGAAFASCAPGAGQVADASDCDDASSAVRPDAVEVCNTIDDDCDALVDDADASVDLADATTWYLDGDADGFGAVSAPIVACALPAGASASSADCDDARADVNPDAPEVCGGGDEDCDGLGDDDDASTDAATKSTWYLDSDGDGYGLDAATALRCVAPLSYAAVGGDCDDALARVNPGAAEVCAFPDDDDCDGSADDADPEGPVDPDTWYLDGDADGHGDPSIFVATCVAPVDHVARGTDCDDADVAVSPDADERCLTPYDDDCDALINDDDPDLHVDPSTWHADADGDGFGAPTSIERSCLAPDGYVADGTDCDDAAPTVYPGADEYCATPEDDDCDGVIAEADPEGAVDEVAGYADTDADGFGDAADVAFACAIAPGRVADDTDCDDANDAVNPGAIELCALPWDEDCDGGADDADPEGPADPARWYADADGDRFGWAASFVDTCVVPSGYVAVATDCDDAKALVNPSMAELCATNYDDDCDGSANDADSGGVVDPTTWYADVDGDGFGDAASPLDRCLVPDGYVASSSDCDDAAPAVFPGADETCGTAYDDDCDGANNDADPEGPVDPTRWFADTDGDSYGNPSVWVERCLAPVGTVSNDDDCDDGLAVRSPSALEVCATPYDDDCDGAANDLDPGGSADASSWYADGDGDGFGDPGDLVVACLRPSGFVANDDDCDDGAASVNPAATEVCDGVDNDCDAGARLVDDADASLSLASATTWFLDGDGDGHAPPDASFVRTCVAPAGYYPTRTDCDDTRASVSPDEVEVCNNMLDDDCDPLTTCLLEGTYSAAPADADLYWEGSAGSNLGMLAFIGDTSGDGADDVLVGAPFSGGSGQVFLLTGLPASGSASAVARTTLSGLAGSAFGTQLATADIGGDGFVDVVVGAPSELPGDAIYVFSGPLPAGSLSTGSATHRIVGGGLELASDPTRAMVGGPPVVVAGSDALVVGAPDFDSGAGKAWVFWEWAPAMNASDASVTFNGLVDSEFGYATALGDADGDGLSDVVIGAPSRTVSGDVGAGGAFVFRADTLAVGGTLVPADADLTLNGPAPDARLGTAVTVAEDVLGAGVNALVVTSPYDVGVGAAGRAAVYTLDAAGAFATTSTLLGRVTDSLAGFSAAGVGDPNGDAYADLMVGAPLLGESYLIYGGPDLATGTHFLGDDASFGGQPFTALSGVGLARVGDVDGDGYDDVPVSVPASGGSGGAASGRVFVFFGLGL
jgi:hypothetical protein